MTDIDQSYYCLKSMAVEKFVSSGTNNVKIYEIKALYKSQIESNRAYSQIFNLSDLFHVLEKRSCLSPIEIDALEYIFSSLNLSQVCIEDHKELINRSGQRCNFLKRYDECNTHEQVTPGNDLNLLRNKRATTNRLRQGSPNNSTNKANQFHQGYSELPDEVIRIISERIGSSWKSLGYQLGLQVATVDVIEEDRSITTNEERARLVFHHYQQNVGPTEIKLNLLKALELIQRKDLHDKVQKYFLLNV